MTTEIKTPAGGQTFNFARFKNFFAAYLSANSRKLMLSAGTCFIIFLIVFLLPEWLSNFDAYHSFDIGLQRGFIHDSTLDPYWDNEFVSAAFLLMILVTLSGNMMYSAMHGKGNRLSMLTMPVSQLEKFAALFLIYIVGFFAVFYLSFFLADVARVLLVKSFSKYGMYAHTLPPANIFNFDLIQNTNYDGETMRIYSLVTLIYATALTLGASFSLGSILWQKTSYLKTLCSLALLQTVLTILVVVSINIFFDNSMDISPRIELSRDILHYDLLSLLLLLFPALLFWFGYLRFKDTDVVERW